MFLSPFVDRWPLPTDTTLVEHGEWTEQDLSGAPDQDKAKLGLTHAWEERASSGLGLSPSSAFFLGRGRPGACPPPPHGLLPLLAFVHIKFYFVRSGPSYRLFFFPF